MSTALTTAAALETEPIHGSSLWSDAWFRLKKNRLALFGLGFFLFMICISVLGPFFTGYRYEDTDLPLKASPPLDKIISRVETLKNGDVKQENLALSNIEDEFLELPRPERKAIAAKSANREQYTAGNVHYEPSNQRHFFGTDSACFCLIVVDDGYLAAPPSPTTTNGAQIAGCASWVEP